MEYRPHPYQQYTIEHILKHKKCGLFLDMGLGKTSCTLTAVESLIFDYVEIQKVLVIAPKRVAENTWSDEVEKWEHLKELRVSVISGKESHRIQALKQEADIYTIGRDNVVWLIEYLQHNRNMLFFDTLIIDELSSFKSSKSKRFKALKKITPLFDRIIGLTGTPAPNSLIELWPQMYLLDKGERLGKTQSNYKDNYFYPTSSNSNIVYSYGLKPGAKKIIYDKIGDIVMSLEAKDNLKMPELIKNYIELRMPNNLKGMYDEYVKEKILTLNEEDLTANSAGVLANKLLQFANGNIYDDEKRVHHIHDLKIEALKEIVDTSNEQPILVFYSFKHDLDAIQKVFNVRKLEASEDFRDWNAGKISIAVAHPASIGHGLNIQAGGHIIVWYGLTWSLELYQQANARLYRQGQKESVVIHHLVLKDTIDDRVIQALNSKDKNQSELINAVKAIIKDYRR